MNITFATKELLKLANEPPMANRKLGTKRVRLFHRRLQDMMAASCFEDLKYLPGNYHQLSANRKDQWACDLDQPYRLVFMPGEDSIPKDLHGKQLLREIRIVEILEITNYHKEH